MEFSERKRSRKSQSFKLVNEDYHDVYKVSGYSSDVNGETKEAPQFVGDEGLEIRKQITGMRRLLNDSTGRTYQRIGKEGEKLKEEPQELEMAWGTQSPPSPPRPRDNLHPSRSTSWNDVSPQTSYYSGQYGTRSKTVHNQVKSTVASNGEVPVLHSSSGSSCCTCSCQPTLQAILQELRAMRKFIQIQAAAQNRLQPPLSCVCAQRSTAVRKRNRKKKAPEKAAAAVTPARKPSLLANESKLTTVVECSRLPGADHIPKEENNTSGFGIVHEAASSSSDPEVQLAEGFGVFMAKSQLDSILSNYTRSGSLLFRKLVCAFFDDKTLANSLPNGKRKRGLNDNRKGLDQNIVGAIKVFTEKYCTANHVDKIPGPRDWVQILQDQIKLARRRLKRGSGTAESEEKTDVSVLHTGNVFEAHTEEMWLQPKPSFSP
ncbi:BEN domain-containing protein 7 isoform X2 [Microcaecilia unicolor]|uniref:BEN domain-containing protein 7 isoform X2 n=1 Tax=Microcaecilia unicolor TaxID=1415580 RepID=A0A6P7Z940_9AMPH|nr:BEN domain-containing protein 7 isoform X2 [Microcaecilia unicolor]